MLKHIHSWQRRFAGFALGLLLLGPARPTLAELPVALTSSAAMADRLNGLADANPTITLETIGQSVEGKPLIAVRIMPKARMAIRRKVLFIGAQHGDEHAGKEAILELIADLASGDEPLLPGVELWAVPMANPDGVDQDQRRNAKDVDLNRDHLILSQPETIALHRLVQRERPHVIVDCHEFTRDSKDYTDQGWSEWPLIMMDGANSPLLPAAVGSALADVVDAMQPVMDEAGFNYQRYTVGGPPPHAELRYSTLDPDDARNGLSFYGGVGFIIESGVKRSADDPQADLAERVSAYRMLLHRFLSRPEPDAAGPEDLLSRVHNAPLESTIVTNAFWSASRASKPYPVIALEAGGTLQIEAINFADEVAIKSKVSTPMGYAVVSSHADAYADLLDKHAVNYERLDAPRIVSAELAKLQRVEEDFDPIYERYGGRQIVAVEPDAAHDLPAGSLWIDLAKLAEAEPMMARRAIKVLEPQQLYGLYQWPAWRATVSDDGSIPVIRVMSDAPHP